jgi:hypothetical protein
VTAGRDAEGTVRTTQQDAVATATTRPLPSYQGGLAVIRMWLSQTKEDGERLSQCDRDALIERYCDLFGIWPE